MTLRPLFLALLTACGTPTSPPGTSLEAAPEAAAAPAAEPSEPTAAGWETFGEAFDLSGEAIAAKALLDDPASKVGQTLTVEGRVADVCQQAGCWMVVSDEAGRSMRVRMKGHAFAVAKDGTGATARVHGEIVAKAVRPDEVAHFASEAAKPDAMPENALAAGATTYEIVASAVALRR
jgi:hypothetical protein